LVYCLSAASGNLDSLAKSLRNGAPSVFGRIQKDRLLLDLRTVFPRQDLELVEAFRRLGAERPDGETDGSPKIYRTSDSDADNP
jgi:hypothetical protein